MGRKIELIEIEVPDFGLPTVQPEISVSEYESRIAATRGLMEAHGLTHLVVYGDREHFPNLAFLTGFDPRFEEAMLVLGHARPPRLLVGNEGFDYARRIVGIDHELTLFQSFSLLGQWRDNSPSLSAVLKDEGIDTNARVGTAGWKSYDSRESEDPTTCIEIPAYIVDSLRDTVADRSRVVNATDLFTNPTDGLRVINSADQLAVLEFGATFASQGVRNMTENVKVGRTELEIVETARLNGFPLSCHPVVNAGARSPQLGSPTLNVVGKGDPMLMAIGLWGGLSARAGFVASSEADLPAETRDYVASFVVPYYSAAVDWYQTVAAGTRGGDLFEEISSHFDGRPFHPSLNPGHLIHLDEWVNSGINPDSDDQLQSGMAVQLDIIPVHDDTAYFTTNVEDGIALADEKLRGELATRHPEMWSRVQTRRKFMGEVLGIRLSDDVLPFSNMPGVLRPYLLTPSLALRVG